MTANLKPHDRCELDDLKARVDLVALFESHGLKLKKVGKNYFCHCFLHEEKEASLSVNPQEQLWQCFGCQKGGDALSFLQLKEKLEFPEALELLRRWLGQPKVSAGVNPAELMERLAHLYHQRFWEAEEPRAYLQSRGLDERELWQAFRIGYCDGSVRPKLPNDGPTFEALRQLGILNEEGNEHFRGCLVVPLTHPDRGVVGFYGRRLSPNAQTRHLYLPGQGVLNWTALKGASTVYLTEGVLDALSLWQAGIREVTCLHGVAGVPHDLKSLIKHFKTGQAVLVLDGDRAGKEAAPRFQEQLQGLGLEVRQLPLPEGKDPNAMLCEMGNTQLAEWIQKAQAPQEPAPARQEGFAQGFLLEFGEVRYEVRMLPPFTSRLRVRLRGNRGEKEFLDKVDLYVQRARETAAGQLSRALQLQRFEAEQHLRTILERAEEWVQRQNSQANEQAEIPVEMTEAEREDTLARLRDPGLLSKILADMEELGYVGEEDSKLLAYLIGLSRKLARPLSGSVVSQSGVGKSSLTSLIEDLTPSDEVFHFTRLTDQALYYFPTSLSHKLLILEEREGAEAADYPIRALQSQHMLKLLVSIKDPMTGQFKAQVLEVYGPIAYLETTTSIKMNVENATRNFEIYLDESEEQTQRIQAAQKKGRLLTHNLEQRKMLIQQRHQHMQKLIVPAQICIPYAELITFPTHRLRTRRDHERFLCLIEVSALLRQHQRQRALTEDGLPIVYASSDDYALAYQLAKEVLTSTLHELTKPSYELWQRLREWVGKESDFVFTRRDARNHTGLEDHRLRACLQELVEMEYLEIVTGCNGKQFRYRLVVHEQKGVALPLLAPSELDNQLNEKNFG